MAKDFVFVVFSNYNYKEHKYNVLKECLKSWVSDENYKFAPQDIEIIDICINPENDDKMFVVSTNKEWLKLRGLESIIDNELFSASTYSITLYVLFIVSQPYFLIALPNGVSHCFVNASYLCLLMRFLCKHEV